MTRTRNSSSLAWTIVLAGALFACHHAGQEASNRTACVYDAGAMAEVTLADFGLTGARLPIDHFVLVMQENRTFDHYFSSLTVPGQTVDGAAADAGNPDPKHPGQMLSRFHQSAYCFHNPAEDWDQIHREVNDGGFDGFTKENSATDPIGDPLGLRALGYYTEEDLPYYYALARAFAISDRHFGSTLGPTYPNRLFYMAGTSFGVVDDSLPPYKDKSGADYPNLFTRLDDAHIDWKFYAQDNPSLLLLLPIYVQDSARVLPQSQFFIDAAAGTLPAVSFVEGSDAVGGASPDEDPPADPQVGQAMMAGIVRAVTTSPEWPKSALIFTYDEQGGFYDHVAPPKACIPDDLAPQSSEGGWQFDTLGLRVPLIAVSPYAKRGFVSHQLTDQTSILRMLEARFDLPALTRRDANAEPPFDLFDFDHPNLSVPALPDAEIDPFKLGLCQLAYPPHDNTRGR